MKKLTVITLLLTASLSAQAGVYKCQVGDKTIYQQSPCAAAGSKLNIAPAPHVAAPRIDGRYDRQSSYSNFDDIKRQLQESEARYRAEMDAHDARYRAELEVIKAEREARKHERFCKRILHGQSSTKQVYLRRVHNCNY